MPMPQRIQYPDAIEPLVQFIEETPPGEILDRALEKLRAGVSPQTMLTASALAVTRSTEMPPGHHGGPLHPVVGIHAIAHLADRPFMLVAQRLGDRGNLRCGRILELG